MVSTVQLIEVIPNPCGINLDDKSAYSQMAWGGAAY
jgi:hypothetical protein